MSAGMGFYFAALELSFNSVTKQSLKFVFQIWFLVHWYSFKPLTFITLRALKVGTEHMCGQEAAAGHDALGFFYC